MSMELQEYIFEKKPKRRELLQYVPTQAQQHFCVQVFRNHSFELVEHTITAYLDYAHLGVSFSYSNYDDSFSFTDLNPEADLLIVWIDGARYQNISVQAFVSERIAALKAVFAKPVLVLAFRCDVQLQMADVEVVNVSEICAFLGDQMIDERALGVTGTALSSKAMLHISKVLGLQYLPVMLKPALKGIVVDFDNTLYQGVLGEDGIDGIVLTPGHIRLQKTLKRLSAQGFFLCAASKNELEDVQKLLRNREDFPLKEKDFTKLSVSWNPKADAITEIAGFLNIHPDSLVFVDDNIGELTAVQMAHPQIKLIHAKEDANATADALEMFPGLLKLHQTADDMKRSTDVRSNEERQRLQQTMSHEDYIRSLQLHLTYEINNLERKTRVSELARKTNQFIFNYKRYSETEVEQLMTAEDSAVVTLSLSDKLSDSGLVGVFVGKKQADALVLEECFVSCRALGRGIDEVMVQSAIQILIEHFCVERALVQFQKGPRNAPAEAFVEKHLKNYCVNSSPFAYHIPGDLLKVTICGKKEN